MEGEQLTLEDEGEPLPSALTPKIGEVAMFGEFDHDPFIDGLQGHIWDYPEDAP